ncbi:hypothetical protein OHV05_36540 (plasmid) [Kitasatospora sp. NBC_00070]|uniref:hypothetical protein n=1 Tax=Kitasatospora sp. NBC_00070 TaxID=2975962 RepID=UPI0032534595
MAKDLAVISEEGLQHRLVTAIAYRNPRELVLKIGNMENVRAILTEKNARIFRSHCDLLRTGGSDGKPLDFWQIEGAGVIWIIGGESDLPHSEEMLRKFRAKSEESPYISIATGEMHVARSVNKENGEPSYNVAIRYETAKNKASSKIELGDHLSNFREPSVKILASELLEEKRSPAIEDSERLTQNRQAIDAVCDKTARGSSISELKFWQVGADREVWIVHNGHMPSRVRAKIKAKEPWNSGSLTYDRKWGKKNIVICHYNQPDRDDDAVASLRTHLQDLNLKKAVRLEED